MIRRDKNVWAWQFSPVDTWFFREPKPIEAATGHAARSLFPPTPFTLAGAVRGALKQLGLNDTELTATFEDMHLRGVYVYQNGERLYPVPASLLMGKDGLRRLSPVPELAVQTDKDVLHLPAMETARESGAKAIEDGWLSTASFACALVDAPLARSAVIQPSSLYATQVRLGIARVLGQRVADEGMLYQVEHLRLQPGVSLQLFTRGLSNQVQAALDKAGGQYLVRLGGEGRMASVRVRRCEDGRPHLLPLPDQDAFANKNGLRIVFTTPLLYRNGSDDPKRQTNGEPERHGDWTQSTPFTRQEVNGAACWYTELQTKDVRGPIRLRIRSAAQQRLQMEGAWDFQKPVVRKKDSTEKSLMRTSRGTAAYLPAGTTWFCEVMAQDRATVISKAEDLYQVAERLHGLQLGAQRGMGRGEMAVGCW